MIFSAKQNTRSLYDFKNKYLFIIVHSLFAAWMLSFLFEGEIFYLIAKENGVSPTTIGFNGIGAMFIGLLFSGFFIKTISKAKKMFLFSYVFFIFTSIVFFFSYSYLWTIAMILASFFAGAITAAWGHYLRANRSKEKRLKAIADMIILSNILMAGLNIVATYIDPYMGLALSMLLLLFAFVLCLKLPTTDLKEKNSSCEHIETNISTTSLLLFLFIFITIITVNSGLMYQVIKPSFRHIKWMTCWYWVAPYIIVAIIIRNLSSRINRVYLLYVGIAMMGISFVIFIGFGSSTIKYIVVNALLLGSFGVYDLFWWGVLGEMLEFHKNPSIILGTGLAANVLGILLGGVIGNLLLSSDTNNIYPVLLAFVIIFVTLILLPFLHRHLALLLKNHTQMQFYPLLITTDSEIQEKNKDEEIFDILSEREKQIASKLLRGKTYKKISEELFISENTVKYHVKNIYSKYNIRSRNELIDIVFKDTDNDNN